MTKIITWPVHNQNHPMNTAICPRKRTISVELDDRIHPKYMQNQYMILIVFDLVQYFRCYRMSSFSSFIIVRQTN